MIEVANLRFTYRRRREPALKGLSFEVRRSEIFGFLGPSGAGKSTTQKILIGLLKGYEGRVAVFGRDLSGWGADYYERIGVSFEFPNHYLKLTALENLAYFGALYSGRVLPAERLLEEVGLEQDASILVSQYSKGMKSRLSVARSLLHDPELVFMDEPTAGLDPVNARRIKELIKARRSEGKTILLTTHDMTVADELCDRVAFIVDGEIKLTDSPRELKLAYGEQRVRVEYLSEAGDGRREFPLEGLGDNVEFLEVIRGPVQTIHTLEASLEDVFIRVTGRTLL